MLPILGNYSFSKYKYPDQTVKLNKTFDKSYFICIDIDGETSHI